MLKKLSLTVILALIPCLLSTNYTLAHSLKSSGTISALMHINPNDDPVAGQDSEILFLINDKDKKFQAENCNCTASVIENDKELFSSPLFKGKTSYRGIFAPAIPFVFPHKGIYTIKLAGEPKDHGLFQNFSVSYKIRIDKDTNTPPEPPFKKPLGYGLTIIILIGTIYLIKLFFIQKPESD